MKNNKSNGHHPVRALYLLAIARISLGLIFLWAFFDKLIGLGFATCRDAKTDVVTTMCQKAWIEGGSPTVGFLKFAAKGPFEGFYHNLAGNSTVDWLFMIGLLLIGIALVTGVATRLATVSGVVLVLMMWSAVLPPENHPVLDDHIIYALLLGVIMYLDDNQKLGLGNWWRNQPLVKRIPLLK